MHLLSVIAQLSHPHRTSHAIPFEVQGSNAIPNIKEQPCPGGYKVVKLFAGTTFHGNNAKTENVTSDAATVVFFDDMCATTVVDGCDFTAIPKDSKQYSALITTAALRTHRTKFLL